MSDALLSDRQIGEKADLARNPPPGLDIAGSQTNAREDAHGDAALGVLSDNALMVRVGAGDKAAYRVLVERHSGRSLGFATRVLGNAADGEEVMQDAFVRLWRNAPNWNPDGARFSTWFYRVVMNLCIDRQRARKPGAVPLDDAGDPADDRPGADSIIHESEVSGQVKQAIDTLPDRQRAAISLCYLSGLSNREAADVLGINIKALESLLVRGRQALKKKLVPIKNDLLGADA